MITNVTKTISFEHLGGLVPKFSKTIQQLSVFSIQAARAGAEWAPLGGIWRHQNAPKHDKTNVQLSSYENNGPNHCKHTNERIIKMFQNTSKTIILCNNDLKHCQTRVKQASFFKN